MNENHGKQSSISNTPCDFLRISRDVVFCRFWQKWENRPKSLLEGDFTSPVGPIEASTPMDDSI
ncbi:hypothetical protein OUZ56_000796 [Daphnia magna]|uniref:Uncharacterized protein n=1 Tax=Daphnia magna TaxID=35525 RepID=A0ABR0A0S8_9CRUS|nr:hypothetical protein OUZ56_000796 [Daphnia magna]